MPTHTSEMHMSPSLHAPPGVHGQLSSPRMHSPVDESAHPLSSTAAPESPEPPVIGVQPSDSLCTVVGQLAVLGPVGSTPPHATAHVSTKAVREALTARL